MKQKMKFIDLFAGCGGLSLGLMQAGFKGVFAIEKTPDAFATLKHNLTDKKTVNSFEWPSWLPCKNMTTSDLLKKYPKELKSLKGEVDLIAGGPPCQGFSFIGLRNPDDPRNRLTEEYIKIVSLVKPKFLILENVKGFKAAFKNDKAKKKQAYSEYVISKLETLSYAPYKVFHKILKASLFGVPQTRPRFVMIAIRKDILNNKLLNCTNDEFFEFMLEHVNKFKLKNGMINDITTVGEAISDLEIGNGNLIDSVDTRGFRQLNYKEPKKLTPYLKLMRRGIKKGASPDSLRIPNHKKETLDKFKYILKHAERGAKLSDDIKNKLGMKKQCFTIMSPHKISATITTLPDDFLHYSEPRVLTVRENARIQSFPDWFEFKGKYTTGGDRRKEECPRYTQVGNAVPPLMAEAIGNLIKNI